ncbi:MAG TPA: UbiA family prenyltransferase [Verrucomicrobiae bacterium]|nr:UbiA family prenyltransferase [Verrucomicrobiae bacterium]
MTGIHAEHGHVAVLRPAICLVADLCLHVAAGVLALGWATSRLLDFPAWPCAPLWLAGALLVYTANRICPDPADPINRPERLCLDGWVPRARIGILIASGCVVVAWPLVHGDWTLFLGATGAAGVGLAYVMRVPGLCRLKDLPAAKTFIPATVVSAVILYPALGRGIALGEIGPCAAWLLCLTCFNAMLCDHLDRAGDAATGVRTLPVLLGERMTRVVLWLLVAAVFGCAIGAGVTIQGRRGAAWLCVSLSVPTYLALLLARIPRVGCSCVRECWIEGMLFVPAIAIGVAKIMGSATGL